MMLPGIDSMKILQQEQSEHACLFLLCRVTCAYKLSWQKAKLLKPSKRSNMLTQLTMHTKANQASPDVNKGQKSDII